MSTPIGIISSAHMHAHGFTAALKADDRAKIVGVWDDNADRGKEFAARHGIAFFDEADALFGKIDAAVICSENMKHADHIEWAAERNLHILCEKPIAPNRAHWDRISAVTEDLDRVKMTAFPCPFSPTFLALSQKVRNEDLGRVLAINGTNQGKCPFGWFVDSSLSGGGAMIDHTVHVVDLMRRLLCCEPEQVQAQVGNKMYGEAWEDCAMVTIRFENWTLATVDSSWSRPKNDKSWGNVTLKVLGEKGLCEADLFIPGIAVLTESGFTQRGVGANFDQLMVSEFLSAIEENRQPSVTLEDGLWASRVAIAAYESVAQGGEFVTI